MSTANPRPAAGAPARLASLALALAALLAPPAPAAPPPPPTVAVAPALPLAEESGGWSISKLFSGLNNQTRVIQFCAVIMCLALFILMRKFAPSPGEGRKANGGR